MHALLSQSWTTAMSKVDLDLRASEHACWAVCLHVLNCIYVKEDHEKSISILYRFKIIFTGGMNEL